MSYFSLEDLLNAVQRSRSPYYNIRPAQEFRPAYNHSDYTYPPAASPNPHAHAAESDEESDDYEIRPCYPAYYSRGGYPQQVYARPQPRQQPQQQHPTRKAQHLNTLFDLFDLLNGGESSETSASPNAQAQAPAAASTDAKPSKEASEKENSETKKDELKKDEKKAASPASAPAVKQQPRVKRSHSTAEFQEPRPKIEVSSRNLHNPAIPYSPQTNIYETNESYDIILAVPGASIKNLDIDFHPTTNELIVKGKVPQIAEAFGPSKEAPIKIDEIRTGSIERRIKFPYLPKIVEEKITAKYSNGLLIVKVPKNLEPEKKPKRKVTIEEVPDEALIRSS